MNDCKYCVVENSNNIEHVTCTNPEIRRLNHFTYKEIPCLITNNTNCSLYESKNLEEEEWKRKFYIAF